MTRELIIEGQHVDLAPDTDITLEYVSNILSDPGKISLSHSYTVKLPKTARNARILDLPDSPGHESGMSRRFLTAQYFRNGVDLLGETQAYLLSSKPDSYEVALIWNTLQELQALSQSKLTLNDLKGLGVLTWIGSNGQTPDYMGMQSGSNGALFAWYESGLGALKYPEVNAATHPSMGMSDLLRLIMEQAGVPYEVKSDRAQDALWSTKLLAAPSHKPSRAMEWESGRVANYASFMVGQYNGVDRSYLTIGQWDEGWDAPETFSSLHGFDAAVVLGAGDNDTHRVIVNLQAPASADLAECAITIRGAQYDDAWNLIDSEELTRAYFQQNESGWFVFFDEEIKLSGWPRYVISHDYEGLLNVEFTKYDQAFPLVAANRVHPDILIEKDNRFPIEGNLPDIGQWEFVKACMGLFGMVPVIRGGVVEFYDYGQIFDKSGAVDWSGKVAMTEDGTPEETTPTADSWARSNDIVFAENDEANDPTASLHVSDATLAESREWIKLPFAASRFSSAVHYKIGKDNEVEDVDIEPRIMTLVSGKDAEGHSRSTLRFTDNLAGEGLAAAYYSELQEVIRKPVCLTLNVRLHELDLAQLDLVRPVYLRQYGQYYAILKIQTSRTDLCKVELLQIS